MKVSLQHPKYGQIEYIENLWNGKKKLLINGVAPEKKNRKTYLLDIAGEKTPCHLAGDHIRGIALHIEEENISLARSAKWYELAFSVFIAAFIIVWGNTLFFSQILPIMGGVLGGAIAGLMAALNFFLLKKQSKLLKKILISIGMLLAAFAAAFVIYPLLLIISLIFT